MTYIYCCTICYFLGLGGGVGLGFGVDFGVGVGLGAGLGVGLGFAGFGLLINYFFYNKLIPNEYLNYSDILLFYSLIE
jgi:hypothetical protein